MFPFEEHFKYPWFFYRHFHPLKGATRRDKKRKNFWNNFASITKLLTIHRVSRSRVLIIRVRQGVRCKQHVGHWIDQGVGRRQSVDYRPTIGRLSVSYHWRYISVMKLFYVLLGYWPITYAVLLFPKENNSPFHSHRSTFSSPSQHFLEILLSFLLFTRNLLSIRHPNSCIVVWQRLIRWLVLLSSLSLLPIGCPWFTNTGVFVDTQGTQSSYQAMYYAESLW